MLFSLQVIIPMAAEQVAQNISVPSLAPQTPQCKALYDFNKYHEDDEVCLHFNKVRNHLHLVIC